MRADGNAGEWTAQGLEMHGLAAELFPLHRSITGDGVRKTFEILSRHLPLQIAEVPTGTKVFDWTVPQEWRIRDAYIADTGGKRVVQYADSNLHVVNYSQPVQTQLTWQELQAHLHTIPEQPNVIPYRTAFFRDSWGFCVNRRQYQELKHGGPWDVLIDSEFFDGSLTLAECELPGSSDETVLFHCHTCHPSLANDNLSGLVVATYLAKYLQSRDRRYTYRFVFAAATIGAIASLAIRPRAQTEKIKHGLVLTLLGDSASFTYKMSRSESATIDRLVPQVLEACGVAYSVTRFSPTGYDERQYASPGINLPVGRLTRSVHGDFPEYHTSADNLDFIKPDSLAESLRVCVATVVAWRKMCFPSATILAGNLNWGGTASFAFGENDDRGRLQEAMMWVLSLADGQHDVVSIAQRSGLSLMDVHRAIDLLATHELIGSRDELSLEDLNQDHDSS